MRLVLPEFHPCRGVGQRYVVGAEAVAGDVPVDDAADGAGHEGAIPEVGEDVAGRVDPAPGIHHVAGCEHDGPTRLRNLSDEIGARSDPGEGEVAVCVADRRLDNLSRVKELDSPARQPRLTELEEAVAVEVVETLAADADSLEVAPPESDDTGAASRIPVKGAGGGQKPSYPRLLAHRVAARTHIGEGEVAIRVGGRRLYDHAPLQQVDRPAWHSWVAGNEYPATWDVAEDLTADAYQLEVAEQEVREGGAGGAGIGDGVGGRRRSLDPARRYLLRDRVVARTGAGEAVVAVRVGGRPLHDRGAAEEVDDHALQHRLAGVGAAVAVEVVEHRARDAGHLPVAESQTRDVCPARRGNRVSRPGDRDPARRKLLGDREGARTDLGERERAVVPGHCPLGRDAWCEVDKPARQARFARIEDAVAVEVVEGDTADRHLLEVGECSREVAVDRVLRIRGGLHPTRLDLLGERVGPRGHIGEGEGAGAVRFQGLDNGAEVVEEFHRPPGEARFAGLLDAIAVEVVEDHARDRKGDRRRHLDRGRGEGEEAEVGDRRGDPMVDGVDD